MLVILDRLLDKRLVRTFLSSLSLIIPFRDRVHGLLLSEMGGVLLDAEHERAGTKRLSNLLHSARWSAQVIEPFLWQRATAVVQQAEQREEPLSAIWVRFARAKPIG